MIVSKIISGGQTGVDRGALEAAHELGFPYGGLIPMGRRSEDGIVPEKFDKMDVAPRRDYLFRTEMNVTHSDCTLIISRYNTNRNRTPETLEGGTARTEQFCNVHCKPYLVLFKSDLDRVVTWLQELSENLGKEDLVLNIAGQRESKSPGIQVLTHRFVARLIAWVRGGRS